MKYYKVAYFREDIKKEVEVLYPMTEDGKKRAEEKAKIMDVKITIVEFNE